MHVASHGKLASSSSPLTYDLHRLQKSLLKTKVLAFIPRSLKNGHFTLVGRPIGQNPLTMSYTDFDHPPRLSIITQDVYKMTILGILCVDI